MRQKLIMVMGIQRSGTTALFEALASGKIAAFNESPQDYIYDNYYLRPEPELRAPFASIRVPILLKPISETFRRSVRDVAEEYAAYDLRIVWIYRDPVNSSQSLLVSGYAADGVTAAELAAQWRDRNGSVLEALATHSDRITIVRYEDLVESPSVLKALGKHLGIEVALTFRGDSGGGRRNMAPESQAAIDQVTEETRRRLDAARTFVPAEWNEPEPEPVPEPAPAAEMDPQLLAFFQDPMGTLRIARSYGTVYAIPSQPNSWAVLGYDDAMKALENLRYADFEDYDVVRSRLVGWHRPADHERFRELLERHFAPDAFVSHAAWLRQHVRDLLTELRARGEFDFIADFAGCLTARLAEQYAAGNAPGSLMACVAADSNWNHNQIEDFRYFLPKYLPTLSTLLTATAYYLLYRPDEAEALRQHPENLPAFCDEMSRLFPRRLGASGIALRPMDLGGHHIAEGDSVTVAAFMANRDPDRYRLPDQVILDRPGPPHLTFEGWPAGWLIRRLSLLEYEAIAGTVLAEFPQLVPVCPASRLPFLPPPEFYMPASLPVRLRA